MARTKRTAEQRDGGDQPRVGFVKGPRDETRERLLEATLEYLRHEGISDLSMRKLADEIGTSHRLLIYHFGTKEGLLVEVVRAIEREQREWLNAITEAGVTPAEQLQLMWERTRDPALDRHLRLFVEVYGHTVQGKPHTEALVTRLVGNWMASSCELFIRLGVPPAEAPRHARLSIATIRGLMLDLLVTGDEEMTGAAWAEFVSRYVGPDGRALRAAARPALKPIDTCAESP